VPARKYCRISWLCHADHTLSATISVSVVEPIDIVNSTNLSTNKLEGRVRQKLIVFYLDLLLDWLNDIRVICTVYDCSVSDLSRCSHWRL
jgi:hypothetical protein